MLGAREFDARVTAVESLTYDTKLVRFGLTNGSALSFKPGQYVQLLVPGTDQFRAYSIASPPSRAQARELELIVRYVPGGLCTGWIHKALAVGDDVKLTGPFGDFYLREDSNREIIAIGGGSGMAPMRSIITHLAEQGMPRKVTLFFGARTLRDLFYVEDFRALERKFRGSGTSRPCPSRGLRTTGPARPGSSPRRSRSTSSQTGTGRRCSAARPQ